MSIIILTTRKLFSIIGQESRSAFFGISRNQYPELLEDVLRMDRKRQ